MAKKWQKVSAGVLTAVLATSVMATATACGEPPVDGNYTYHTYTTVSPSNWNELTYKDGNDTQIMSYLGSSFFEFDYNFDNNGNVIEDGSFKMQYSAATDLEDVTADYAETWYEGKDVAQGGYAWKITLRSDLKWHDGTPIKAQDFVYTMKQQLDPDFKNYRAESFYGANFTIRNAKEYVYQGSSGTYSAATVYDTYSTDMDSNLIFHLGKIANPDDPTDEKGIMSYITNWIYGQAKVNDAATVARVLMLNFIPDLDLDVVASMEGKTLAEIKANASMNAEWGKLIGWWQSEPNEELHFFTTEYEWPEVSWDKVGILAPSDYELVVIYDNHMDLVDENGDLTYEAGYYTSSLPLVKQDIYEDCKRAPVTGSTLWTSIYNSSVSTTASWGPYMLTEFQSGRYYKLERNPYWYGYKDANKDGKYDMYPGQYKTDVIECDTVASWNTAWQMFQLGEVDGIGIDVTIADDYKTSDRAYFTPGDYIQSIHLQSSKGALKKYEDKGVVTRDNRLLKYDDFRKAISLGLNRLEYAQTCTTSSLPSFGFFNTMHYYDVANGGMYRATEVAKEALLRTYGYVEVSEGQWSINDGAAQDIDAAVDSLTGYNLDLAQDLIESAVAAAKEAGDYADGDVVKLIWGTSTDTETTQRHYNYMVTMFEKLVKGTSLEGKVELVYNANYGTEWANKFLAGEYDISMSGWEGGAWNPIYLMGAYILEDNRFALGWDPYTDSQFEFTYKNAEGTSVTETMSVGDWYDMLSDTSTGALVNTWTQDEKLELLAAIEESVLKTYWSIPTLSQFSASLMSYKCDYISYEYNTFMGYGGIRYMKYNYTDEEWTAYVESLGQLDYKK